MMLYIIFFIGILVLITTFVWGILLGQIITYRHIEELEELKRKYKNER